MAILQAMIGCAVVDIDEEVNVIACDDLKQVVTALIDSSMHRTKEFCFQRIIDSWNTYQ